MLRLVLCQCFSICVPGLGLSMDFRVLLLCYCSCAFLFSIIALPETYIITFRSGFVNESMSLVMSVPLIQSWVVDTFADHIKQTLSNIPVCNHSTIYHQAYLMKIAVDPAKMFFAELRTSFQCFIQPPSLKGEDDQSVDQ